MNSSLILFRKSENFSSMFRTVRPAFSRSCSNTRPRTSRTPFRNRDPRKPRAARTCRSLSCSPQSPVSLAFYSSILAACTGHRPYPQASKRRPLSFRYFHCHSFSLSSNESPFLESRTAPEC